MKPLARRVAVLVAVVAVAGAALAFLASRRDDAQARGLAPAATTRAGAVGPTRWRGPQGRVGQFVVHCTYSHSGDDDPIVHPGHHGASHHHDFYGAVTTDSSSTVESLMASETTCDKSPDTAAYWHPTLYDHDKPVVPIGIAAYYRAAPGVDRHQVQTIPTGLAMIAGDHEATGPQPGDAAGWTCGARSDVEDAPPTCTEGAPLHLVLTFQDCWDGVHLDAVDHQSHVAYSADGRCPTSHPVHIPQVMVSVTFPVWGDGHDLRLASGSVYSAHGDFLNAWHEEGLQREVSACIGRNAVCDLASNRGEEPLFAFGT